MKSIVALCALTACIVGSATAFAQDDTTAPKRPTTDGDAKRGIEVGARMGVGGAAGPALYSDRNQQNEQLTDSGHIVVPVFVDIGYRVTKHVYFGGFGEGAWAAPKSGAKSFCPDNADDCSIRHYVVGGQVRYHFTPDRRFDPSLGLGLGYQWLTESVTAGPVNSSRTFRGMEWITATFTGDYAVAPGVVLGPYITTALGQYTRFSSDVTGAGPLSGSRSGSIDDVGEKRWHVWASLGIRGAFTARL